VSSLKIPLLCNADTPSSSHNNIDADLQNLRKKSTAHFVIVQNAKKKKRKTRHTCNLIIIYSILQNEIHGTFYYASPIHSTIGTLITKRTQIFPDCK